MIIPTHNRAATIVRAVESVLRQSYKKFELIVVDDASGDETLSILKKYPEARTLVMDSSQGVSAARNRGVAVSDGEWLAFLDSDDEWLSGKLEKQLERARRDKVPLVHSEEIWIRGGRRVNPKKKHCKFGGDIFDKCLKLCLISPSSVVMRRELFDEMGGFDEEFPVCEDYDLWLKITSLYRVGFVPEPLIVKYGGHSDQLSRRYKCMDYWRVRALERILFTRTFEPERRQRVVEEMCFKAGVLAKGMEKHENRENLAYIKDILWRFGGSPDGRRGGWGCCQIPADGAIHS